MLALIINHASGGGAASPAFLEAPLRAEPGAVGKEDARPVLCDQAVRAAPGVRIAGEFDGSAPETETECHLALAA